MAAPFVSGSLALLAAARPDLPQAPAALALEKSAPRPPLLTGLLGYGRLNVGDAMHLVLPGALWRAAPPVAAPSSCGSTVTAHVACAPAGRRRCAGRPARRARRAWRVLLDGHRVRTLPGVAQALRKRVVQPGKHRWKVVGVAADGARIGAARARVLASPPLADAAATSTWPAGRNCGRLPWPPGHDGAA